jgi:hypothetical protein
MRDMRMQDTNLQDNRPQSLIQTAVRGASGMTHAAPTHVRRLWTHAWAPPRPSYYIDYEIFLHYIKSFYIDLNININLYDYIKLQISYFLRSEIIVGHLVQTLY